MFSEDYMEPHVKALNQAKISLLSTPETVFFSTVCFSLKHVFNESVRTAATDGKTIEYSPSFFMSLTNEERVFLMLHETLHVAYMHMDRKAGRDHTRWNAACDYVINLMLVKRGFKMPSIGLLDRKYEGMSAEQVYKLLPENPKMDPSLLDLNEPAGNAEQLEQDIQEILVRASIQSKMAGEKPGSIPGDIQVMLEKLLNPKLPWTTILRKYLSGFSRNDYSLKKPNKRFFPQYHLPSLYSLKLMDLTIAVDCSGSVSDHDFTQFVSEVASVFKMLKPKKITLIPFDTQIRKVMPIKSLLELEKCQFTGRGGTDITPVVKWAQENKPQLLLVFSDGEFRFPYQETNTNTLWIIHNNERFTAPYGKVIHYTI